MYSKKEIQITTPNGYIFIYKKNHLSIMNMMVFNFQNMMNMHKGYAYQNFNFIALKKLTRI
jgi:hypothetical protein